MTNLIDLMEFPEDPTLTIEHGQQLSIEIQIVGQKLIDQTVYGYKNTPNVISVIDESNTLRDIPVRLLDKDSRTDTNLGNYLFKGSTKTDAYTPGNLRVFGTCYDLKGMMVPVRLLYSVVNPS